MADPRAALDRWLPFALFVNEMVNYLDDTLSALADPTRRGVVDLLRAGPRRAGELADALGASGPATSRHLRTLERSGLVDVATEPDDARARVYRLRPERFEELSMWLGEIRAFWVGQLAAFKEYADRQARTGPAAQKRQVAVRRRAPGKVRHPRHRR